MNKEFIHAIEDIEKEKGISKELMFEAIESALLLAYKKNYGSDQNVRVEIDRETGATHVYLRRDIVEVVEDEDYQITLEEAREIDPEYEIGDYIDYEIEPADFGRIAAQNAKHVVLQRIKEAERNMIFEEFSAKVGQVITGKIQRRSRDKLFVNLGRTEGILTSNEQVAGERFDINDRIKIYVLDVKKSTKGPQVFLSRSHPGLVSGLFEMEVPEIEDGLVEIRSIAREAGSRTKIAVFTEDENIDPVGACVGARGSRVQGVVDELYNEKIDIITWSDDPEELITNVLSPAKVEEVIIDEEEKEVTVVVPDYQLSLAIGKSGQNVRLAARLCGWKIDIKSHTQYFEDDDFEDEVGITDDVAAAEVLAEGKVTEAEVPAEEEMLEAEALAEEEVTEAEAPSGEDESEK